MDCRVSWDSDVVTTSYWLDTAPAFSGEEGEVAREADVVIVGGGLTGLSAALSLVRRGASVTLFEQARVAGEASGRNGGQCNNGTLQNYATLAAKVGIDRARHYYLTYNRAVDTVERLVAEEGIDCGFNRSGKLKLAAKPSHYEGLARAWESLRQDVDPDVRLLSADELRQEICSDVFYGGLIQPLSAQLHIGRFAVGLAEAAKRRGAQIHQGAQVTALKRLPTGRWRVTTPKGSIEAAQVLVANGGSGPGPFNWFRRRIIPVGSFIIVSEPLGQEQAQRLMPGNRACVTTMNIGHYFRLTPDWRLLFGGRAKFTVSTTRTDKESGDLLRAAMIRVFPQLKEVNVDYCWGGSVDMSMDRLPRVGEREPGLYFALGFSGHGVQMATHMGQVMGDVLNGESSGNPWNQPWPAVPGYFGKPWFLPAVGAYYRVLDRLT